MSGAIRLQTHNILIFSFCWMLKQLLKRLGTCNKLYFSHQIETRSLALYCRLLSLLYHLWCSIQNKFPSSFCIHKCNDRLTYSFPKFGVQIWKSDIQKSKMKKQQRNAENMTKYAEQVFCCVGTEDIAIENCVLC